VPNVLEVTAQKFNWKVEQREASLEAARTAAQSGANVVVADGFAVAPTAREFPQTYFINMNVEAGTDLPPNLLAIPVEKHGHREDQAGFLAGMAAGFATETQRVAAVTAPTTPEGLKYRNGFVSGVRYTCAKCRIDLIDLADPNATDFAGLETAKYVSYGVDAVFAAAGPAGSAALTSAAQAGAWVIGSSGLEAYTSLPGAESGKMLTVVFVDPGAALAAALTAYRDGQPLTGVQALSLANGGVYYAPPVDAPTALSPLDWQDIEAAKAKLASGALETGIDPLTGAER
jgi:basic membrane protein A